MVSCHRFYTLTHNLAWSCTRSPSEKVEDPDSYDGACDEVRLMLAQPVDISVPIEVNVPFVFALRVVFIRVY